MPVNRMYRRPEKYQPRRMGQTGPRPWGGAIPAVQKRFEMAQSSAERKEFPLLASLIYAAPPVVMYPPEFSSGSNVMVAGGGMINRIYQPSAEKPKPFGQKLTNWFKSGRFE